MKKADQWSGLALLVMAVLIFWGSLRMPYGNIHNPGAGLFPLWLGIILGALSLALILRTIWKKEEVKMAKDLFAKNIRWGKVISVLIALLVYGYAIDFLGFLIITFLFMAFLLWFIDPQPWRSVIGWALGGSLGSYLIFEVWLKLRLPKGFLGV